MGIGIEKPLGVGGISSNITVDRNRYQKSFGNNLQTDTFERTGINRYTTESAIINMVKANPKIITILKEVNAPLSINMKELNHVLANHASDTKNIAKGITEHLPFSLQNKVDTKALLDAAYLHDVGKVLIPANILNKAGKLDERETQIMHKHSELGYELLKSTDIDKKTLHLIRNHHQNAKKTGYPFVDNSFNADLNLQILSLADKYSALTEKRAYKEPLGAKQALTIIYKDVQEGKLHPFVFKALVNYASEKTTAAV